MNIHDNSHIVNTLCIFIHISVLIYIFSDILHSEHLTHRKSPVHPYFLNIAFSPRICNENKRIIKIVTNAKNKAVYL